MTQNSTLENPLPPTWMMYPNIPQGSIGWRMGYGEDYLGHYYAWFQNLSDLDQARYEEMFPAPVFWNSPYRKPTETYEVHRVQLWTPDGRPRYTLAKLLAGTSPSEPGFVFFWQPDAHNDIPYCLGQWQHSPFKVGVFDYFCTEQYMMAEKARVFGDREIHTEIMKSASPKEIKALGRKVRNFDKTIWDTVKHSVVLNGNYYKFTQNDGMRDFLLSTGDKILVEASPLDKIWGIGLAADHDNARHPAAWKGENLLGFALMEVRDELRRLYQNHHRIDWSTFQRDPLAR